MEPPSPLTPAPWLKICGLRDPAQAAAVARLGVEAIGVIGVAASPRFVPPAARPRLFESVRAVAPSCAGVLVVADPTDDELEDLDPARGHRILQLHGQEPPERCSELRQRLGCELWKALRISSSLDLARAGAYHGHVDALLLDAYIPDQLGGTGQRIPLEWLKGWRSPLPWWLAGGMGPGRARRVLRELSPWGLDASSGVERAPADKDLNLVAELVSEVRSAA